jgi:hypothetical protein
LPRPDYFGLKQVTDLPDAVLTVEDDAIPFSSLGLVATMETEAVAARNVANLVAKAQGAYGLSQG